MDSYEFKKIRDQMNLSRSEFANYFGIAKPLVKAYENGKYEIPDNVIKKIGSNTKKNKSTYTS